MSSPMLLCALLALFCGPTAASWQLQHVAAGGIASVTTDTHFAVPFPSAYSQEVQFLVWATRDDTAISVDLPRNDLYADIQKREFSGFLVASVCAYRTSGAETRYLVNYRRYADRGRRQIVLVDLSLADLRAKSAEMTDRRIEPVDICVSAKTEGAVKFSAVWHLSSDFLFHFIIEMNTFDRILENDRVYGGENYYPDVLQTFLSSNQTIMALAIWRKGFGEKYHIRYGSSLKEIENNFPGEWPRFRVHRASAVNPRGGDRFYTVVWKDQRFSWTNHSTLPGFFDVSVAFQRPLAFLRSELEETLRREEIPSLQVTVMDSTTLVPIASGVFGYANLAERFPASTSSIYRIASISKLITAMCVVRLLSNGRLRSLDERVFGTGGLLEYEYRDVNLHPLLQTVTVEHLLEHTSGGWGNVERLEEERRDASPTDFLRWAVGRYRPVAWPGHQFYYSNIGYMLLGKVVERLSGGSYESFARREVLEPLGIYARLGRQRKEDALWNEVQYYSHDNANPYFNWDPTRMAAAAGWILSSEQMARLLSDVAARSRTTYSAIVTPSSPQMPFYGRGIQLRPRDGAIFHCVLR
ncbi:hypothetical protein QR680_005637 [Steinernema hermaphroditum]|uniref:Beta-lactamase-related domain-containing protein n=1 Tax=Steinernema hermaphroditum TaxID=289476 RepID=A0AA39HUZ8_9BILA|nr:hypothetical protein QR680_005637 [Steinernema hermaphroditum]